MSGIEVIASIIALAGTGIKCSIVLFDLADRIGSAGEEVRIVATELTLFSNVLEAVRSAFEDKERYHCTPAAYQLVEQVVQHCALVVDDIGHIVSSLQKEDHGDFPSPDWTNRVKWTFKKSKVQVKRQTLESCKSTLHLLLTTLRWSRRFSTDQSFRAPIAHDVEQYPMLSQGLVLAVRSAVNQLRSLEDADDNEHSSYGDDADRNRLFGFLAGLSLTSRKPVQQHVKMRRTSTWLDRLVFDETDTDDDVHPGLRQHRLSSATTCRDPFVLLDKWTENRPQRNQVKPDPEIQNFFSSSNFDFGSARQSEETLDEIPKLPRVFTKPISPKSSMRLAKKGISVSTTLAYSGVDSFLDAKWAFTTSQQWLKHLLDNLSLGPQHHEYELSVVYGGSVKVLPPSEIPYTMLQDLTKYDLKPQLLVRRHMPETPYRDHIINGGTVTASPTTVTIAGAHLT